MFQQMISKSSRVVWVILAVWILAELPSRAASIFLIGNSLTWDTVPSLLDGDVQWHVDCGKSLPYIHEHPEMPCVKNSTNWPEALKTKTYDLLSIQPHYGSTLEEDLEVIESWMKLQPGAVVVLHSGWARSASRAEEYASEEKGGAMKHSQAYLGTLLAKLRERHPSREFRMTRATDLLEWIDVDIREGKAPFAKLEDLYRDAIHMNVVTGRYLMHNAMRKALGLPVSAKGFEKLDPALKKYFDEVLSRLDH